MTCYIYLFSDLSETLRGQTEDLEKKENALEKLEKSLKNAKAELAKKEQARKELTHKVGCLFIALLAWQ